MEGNKPTYNVCVVCGREAGKHHIRGSHKMCNCERLAPVLVYSDETDENILEVYTDGGEV